MRKSLMLLAALWIVAVLSACGSDASTPKEPAHEGEHGEHGGHDAAPEATNAEKLNASFTFPAGAPQAGRETEVSIEIKNEQGERATEFEMTHEKLMHLIVVDHDLQYFNHIHPDRQEDGTFTIRTTFPAGGEYKLFADVLPAGGSGTTLSERVNVSGTKGEHASIEADPTLRKKVDGKEIELALSSLRANEESTLTFEIRDAASKEGIDDLQPYLGAVGHVVILSADAEQYLHVHPLDEAATGPIAQFATSFPEAGMYKIWGQFQHENEVFTVSYVVEAE